MCIKRVEGVDGHCPEVFHQSGTPAGLVLKWLDEAPERWWQAIDDTKIPLALCNVPCPGTRELYLIPHIAVTFCVSCLLDCQKFGFEVKAPRYV